jgi:drug/metabolite transporter (DMT)-like permease
MREVTGAASGTAARVARARPGWLADGVVAVSLWGLAPVATRAVVSHVTPLGVLVLRLGLAALVLLPWAVPVFRRLRLRSAGRLVAAGVLGLIGYNLPVTVGLQWLPASTAGLLLATEPIWVIVLGYAFLAERFAARAWAGSAIALAGVGLLAGPGALAGAAGHRAAAGAGLVLAGTLAFGAYTIVLRPLSQAYGAVPATAASTVAGALPYLVFAGTLSAPRLAQLPPSVWGELGFLALGSTVAGMLLWNQAALAAGSARVSLLLYLEPAVSVAGAVVLLGEHLTLAMIGGALLILAGVGAAGHALPAAPPSPPRPPGSATVLGRGSAEPCRRCRGRRCSAAVSPFAAPQPVVFLGPASLYLGLQATAASRWTEAASHFEVAISAHTQAGAGSFLARTRREYARMLRCRGHAADQTRALALLDRALATNTLKMAATEKIQARSTAQMGGTLPAGPTAAPAVSKNLFRREGEYWTIGYEGTVAHLKDAKGLRYLARLLAHPGREFHATDLQTADSQTALPAPSQARQAAGTGELQVRPDLGDAGELLDAQAKAAYKARLDELQAELDEAERFNDPARAASARQERDFLVDELARAVGLGGRDRKAACHAERARLNVTRAVRAAMANLARANPSLGRHLSATIRTGRYCSYTPDPRAPITWQL